MWWLNLWIHSHSISQGYHPLDLIREGTRCPPRAIMEIFSSARPRLGVYCFIDGGKILCRCPGNSVGADLVLASNSQIILVGKPGLSRGGFASTRYEKFPRLQIHVAFSATWVNGMFFCSQIHTKSKGLQCMSPWQIRYSACFVEITALTARENL